MALGPHDNGFIGLSSSSGVPSRLRTNCLVTVFPSTRKEWGHAGEIAILGVSIIVRLYSTRNYGKVMNLNILLSMAAIMRKLIRTGAT